MEWGDLFKIAATAGVFGAISNQGLTWLREWWTSGTKDAARASYLAIRVAVVLEAFGEACAEVVSEISNFVSSGGNIGKPTTRLPLIGAFPADDESWRALDLTLAEQALTVPNKVSASQRGIDFMNELGPEVFDDDEAMQSCLKDACELGLQAFGLAARLRQRYRFDQYALGHDHCDSFKNVLKKLKDEKEAEERKQAAMMEELNAAGAAKAG